MEKQVWFTSDLHFRHANVITYCDRPWSAENQTNELIARCFCN